MERQKLNVWIDALNRYASRTIFHNWQQAHQGEALKVKESLGFLFEKYLVLWEKGFTSPGEYMVAAELTRLPVGDKMVQGCILYNTIEFYSPGDVDLILREVERVSKIGLVIITSERPEQGEIEVCSDNESGEKFLYSRRWLGSRLGSISWRNIGEGLLTITFL